MRILYTAIAIALVLVGEVRGAKDQDETAAQDLIIGKATIVGLLGKPLGTPVEIVGTILDCPEGEASGMKVSDSLRGRYRIRVEEIAGSFADPTFEMDFFVHRTVEANVAHDQRALDDLVKRMTTPGTRWKYDESSDTNVEAPPMTRKEAEEFRASYVGSRHRLLVYETGAFDGAPRGLPREAEDFASNEPEFRFSVFLVVIRER